MTNSSREASRRDPANVRTPGRTRILWLTHLLPWPPKGGVQQRSYLLMRELSRHHEVVVAGFYQASHQPSAARFHEARDRLNDIVDIAWFRPLPADTAGARALAFRSLLPGPPYTIRWAWDPEAAQKIQTTIRDLRPTAIHYDTISLAPYASCAARVFTTLTHHNVESEMLSRRVVLEKSLPRRIYLAQEARRLARYERRHAGLFDAHIVCSEMDRSRLRQLVGQRRIEIVPNPVDVRYFRPGQEATQVPDSLVFVGGLTWYPNVSAIRFFIEEVWPLIVSRKPEARFYLAGRNPPPDIVRASERDDRIKVLGFVDDIRPLVATAQVYVCPIFDGGGTKLKMIDAMAMGKPIVAHPAACEGLGLQDNVDVAIATTPYEFAGRSIGLLDDHALRKRLGEAARRKAETEFDVTVIGKRLADIYSFVG